MDFAKIFAFLFLLLLPHLPSDLSPPAVSADVIITSGAGRPFGQSSREPKYKVEFHPAESPFYPEDGQESVAMTNKEGKRFMCFLPIVEETKTAKSVNPQNSSSIIIETERRIKLRTPDELMDVLKDRCFYRHEGWWTYEFCYQKHVKQLHLENEKAAQEFVLGVFNTETMAAFNENRSDIFTLKDPRAKDAPQRYHAHQYINGTTCDLTNQPRETEVRFVCSESNLIFSSIKEISTCKYVLTVQCPLLCKHPMFQQERPAWHSIHCNEMPGDKDSSAEDGGMRGTQILDSKFYAT